MSIKRLMLITFFINIVQTYAFAGSARPAAQRLIMAARKKTQAAKFVVQTVKRAVAQKVIEDPKRAMSTVAGGTTGFYVAGDSWQQKTAGTLGGAVLGFTLGGQHARIKDIQTRVKDVQGRVKKLHETAARKGDLKATEAILRDHTEKLHNALEETTINGFVETEQALKRGEDRLVAQIQQNRDLIEEGFKNNEAFHKTVHDKVKNLWTRWGQ